MTKTLLDNASATKRSLFSPWLDKGLTDYTTEVVKNMKARNAREMVRGIGYGDIDLLDDEHLPIMRELVAAKMGVSSDQVTRAHVVKAMGYAPSFLDRAEKLQNESAGAIWTKSQRDASYLDPRTAQESSYDGLQELDMMGFDTHSRTAHIGMTQIWGKRKVKTFKHERVADAEGKWVYTQLFFDPIFEEYQMVLRTVNRPTGRWTRNIRVMKKPASKGDLPDLGDWSSSFLLDEETANEKRTELIKKFCLRWYRGGLTEMVHNGCLWRYGVVGCPDGEFHLVFAPVRRQDQEWVQWDEGTDAFPCKVRVIVPMHRGRKCRSDRTGYSYAITLTGPRGVALRVNKEIHESLGYQVRNWHWDDYGRIVIRMTRKVRYHKPVKVYRQKTDGGPIERLGFRVSNGKKAWTPTKSLSTIVDFVKWAKAQSWFSKGGWMVAGAVRTNGYVYVSMTKS